MRKKVTRELVEEFIKQSKINFYKTSVFSRKIKNIVRGLQVFVLFNPKLKTTAGFATALTYREAKIKNIDLSYKKYKVDSVKKYLVIEINKALAQKMPEKELFDTTSHELAHCVDFVIRGNRYINGRRRVTGFHDPFWKRLHREMGGNGIATYFI